MTFTTSAFIRKNAPDIALNITKLGYKFINLSNSGNYIFTNTNGEAFYANGNGFWHIDCGTNEALFLAIAALREGTDKNQWFINKVTGDWIFCHEECITWMLGGGAELYHKKSTAQELIEHFNK